MSLNLGAVLEAVIDKAEVKGEGTLRLPGSPVPSVTGADLERVPLQDYWAGDAATRAWVRRAVHAEAFAKALEAELERARAKP